MCRGRTFDVLKIPATARTGRKRRRRRNAANRGGDPVSAERAAVRLSLTAHPFAQKGKVVCRAQELASITLKQKRLSSSEIIIDSRRGERHVFGIMNAIDVGAIADALAAKYGPLLTRA